MAQNHIWIYPTQYIAQSEELHPQGMFSTGIASVCFSYLVVWSDLICHPRCFRRNQKPSKAHLFHTSEDSGYSCRKNPVVSVRCALCCRPDINQTPLLSPRHHVLSLPHFAIFFSFSTFLVFLVLNLFVWCWAWHIFLVFMN